MVRGRSIAVTAVAPMNQCAETTSNARGFGSFAPISRHALVKRLVSRVFIGLPCPIKSAGIRAIGALDLSRDCRSVLRPANDFNHWTSIESSSGDLLYHETHAS